MSITLRRLVQCIARLAVTFRGLEIHPLIIRLVIVLCAIDKDIVECKCEVARSSPLLVGRSEGIVRNCSLTFHPCYGEGCTEL